MQELINSIGHFPINMLIGVSLWDFKEKSHFFTLLDQSQVRNLDDFEMSDLLLKELDL